MTTACRRCNFNGDQQCIYCNEYAHSFEKYVTKPMQDYAILELPIHEYSQVMMVKGCMVISYFKLSHHLLTQAKIT